MAINVRKNEIAFSGCQRIGIGMKTTTMEIRVTEAAASWADSIGNGVWAPSCWFDVVSDGSVPITG